MRQIWGCLRSGYKIDEIKCTETDVKSPKFVTLRANLIAFVGNVAIPDEANNSNGKPANKGICLLYKEEE